MKVNKELFTLKARSNSILARYLSLLDVGAFLRWWGAGLLACLPTSWQRLLIKTPISLVLEVVDDDMLVSQEQGEVSEDLGRYEVQDGGARIQALAAKVQQVVLRLPASKALTKIITLPLAAEANLRQVVGFEIDRLTPFAPGQIVYDAHVVERQAAARRLMVRFFAAQRTLVDGQLKQLGALGLFPDSVHVAGAESTVNLLPPERRPRKSRVARHVQWALLSIALLLLVAVALLPLWQQRKLVLELMPQVSAAQRQAEEVLALRETLEDSIASSHFLLQKRREKLFAIDIVNELTRILPDNTWVEQLEIQGEALQVRGQSASASALIGLVEESDLFSQVTFRSPVTADRRTGRDRFYLTARIDKES